MRMPALYRPDRFGAVELVHELTRLHNLGLSGGFLAISSGLALVVLPLPESRSRIMLPVRGVRFRAALRSVKGTKTDKQCSVTSNF